MRKIIFILLAFIVFGCKRKEPIVQTEPQKVAQWFNPIFHNTDFDHELNFPLWFNASLIREHKIYKITKRIFPRTYADSSTIDPHVLPKEKIEYYFDPNGLVDQLIVYTNYDDREIARATFVYQGNMLANGFRNVQFLPFVSVNKANKNDPFTTELFQDNTHQFSKYQYITTTPKFTGFLDLEKGNYIYALKKSKFWNSLSVDSILHPKKEDWVILGSIRKPHKRYHVESLVKETNVYTYAYWPKSGVIKSWIKNDYPFEYHRSFIYDKESSQWTSYIDSTFSEGNFVTKVENKILFDKYKRPIEINHHKINDENDGYFYRETYHYQTKP